jgi:hypothetical protein
MCLVDNESTFACLVHESYECTHSCVLVLVLLEVKQCYIQSVCGVLSAISYVLALKP